MADPITATVGAALIRAVATGTVGAANLFYSIHKDRKVNRDEHKKVRS